MAHLSKAHKDIGDAAVKAHWDSDPQAQVVVVAGQIAIFKPSDGSVTTTDSIHAEAVAAAQAAEKEA